MLINMKNSDSKNVISFIKLVKRHDDRSSIHGLTFNGPNFCCRNPLSMQTIGVATLSMLTVINSK
jgi:hypothetical protein